MLTINGERQAGFCDGVDRRSFLKIGGLAMGGLSLPQLLRAEASVGKSSHKAIIMVFLSGGPPHQDMFRSEDDGASGDSWRIHSYLHQCQRISDLRASSAIVANGRSILRNSLTSLAALATTRLFSVLPDIHRINSRREVGRRWVPQCQSCRGKSNLERLRM